MIHGRVTEDLEPVIRLELRGRVRRRVRVEAIVDTGFNGWLTLPSAVVSRLSLEWDRFGWAILADGNDVRFDVYTGQVHWNGRWVSIPVDCTGSIPLVGMSLLRGFELNLQTIPDGVVTIGPLPESLITQR